MDLKNELMEFTDFVHAGTYSRKLKGDGKFLGWACFNMAVASLVTELEH